MYVIFILVVIAGSVFLWRKSRFEKYIDGLMAATLDSPRTLNMHATDPALLPERVRKFAERSGADPNQTIQGVCFQQAAELRMAPDKAWRKLTTRQVIAAGEPGFVWFANQRTGPFSILQVVDAYVAGEGFLEARLFGTVAVAKLSGPSAARSELMRYLAELAWAPDAVYQNSYLRWVDVGDNMVRVEADSIGGPTFVRFRFDEQGDLVEVQADEREAFEGGKTFKRPWRGFFSDYREIGNRRIPAKCEVGYIYEDGYAAYFRGEMVEYEIISK